MKKILAIIAIATLLASCMTTAPHHAYGITELNKQYSKRCNK